MNSLKRLIGHCVWANKRWINFVDENFRSDEYAVKLLGHIFLGEQAWFQRVIGEEPDRDIWKTLTISQLHEIHAKHDTMYRELLVSEVERVIAYKRFTGEEYRSSVADILLHLTLHGAHHRGQIATYVSKKGTPPINTDFIQYCLIHGL